MQVYLTSKKRNNGLCAIYVVVNHDRDNRKLFPTGVKVESSFWNPDRKEIRRNHPQYTELMDQLDEEKFKMKQKVKEFKSKFEDYQWGDFLLFLEGVNPSVCISKLNFWEALEEHIEKMRIGASYDTYRDIKSMKKHLKCYCRSRKIDLTWKRMTYRFYEDFQAFLTFEQVKPNGEIGLAPNSMGKQVKNIKTFLRKSHQRGYCDYINLDGWKVKQERGEHVYVTDEELQQLWEHDFSIEPDLEKTRDLFLVGAETGLRISDFTADLSFAIKDDVIRYTTQKTLQKVTIPISPLLRKVMDKYNGSLPRMPKHRFQKHIKPVMKAAGINEMIQVRKTIRGKKHTEYVPKWQLITSHTCRRSFCTNRYLEGIPAPIIMQVSGHTTEKAFQRYVQVSKNEVAEILLARGIF